MIVPNSATQELVEAHYAILTRSIHSATATIGQSIVIRTHEAYHAEWLQDLEVCRKLLQTKRQHLIAALPERFTQSLQGNGMFAQLPLSAAEVLALQEHNVFLTPDGRINIAGIPVGRMEELGGKIKRVT